MSFSWSYRVVAVVLRRSATLPSQSHGIVVRAVCGSKHPYLRMLSLRVSGDPGEISQHEAGCLQRVVAGGVRDHQREASLHQHGQFTRHRKHAAVCSDETVPLALVVMQSEQQFPVVDLGKAGIDVANRNEFRFRHELTERFDDGLWEVLIERE